jgi:ATP-dependent Clp protease ATP-binding subunit ClpB
VQIERFTLKAQEAIEAAINLAQRQRHMEVTAAHLFVGMVGLPESQAARYITLAKGDLGAATKAFEARLAAMPAAPKNEDPEPSLAPELEALLLKADDMASAAEEKYVGVNHLVLAMLADDECASAFQKAGIKAEALEEVAKEEHPGGYKAEGAAKAGFENLAKYSTDITELAKQGKLDPVIGRDKVIRQVMQILARRLKNNPIIVGEPGVGKTAVLEGLAQRIVSGDVPDDLKGCAVVSLDLGHMVAGTKFRGEFEERFKAVLGEVQGAGNIILFIDEIHMIIGMGGQEGAMDASNLLKPALSRGQLRCIGATTLNEYRKKIEKDNALTRRFQMVQVDEPTIDETVSILRGLKEKYEVHHGVRIMDSAINAAARLSNRYITDRFLPDKAIDLIDSSAASLRMEIAAKPEEIDRIDQKIIQRKIEVKALERETDENAVARLAKIKVELEQLTAESAKLTTIWQREKRGVLEVTKAKADLEAARREMEQKLRDKDFARVAELQYKIIPDREKFLADHADIDVTKTKYVQEEVREPDVAAAVSRMTGIPVNKMVEGEREKLLKMEGVLKKRVVGQDEPVTAICKAVRRSRAGLQDPSRPIASFLMLGPTGVGKTELAKALAEFMFDDEKAMIRFDMSEFMDKHTVARLVGAPPGYVGYDEGGMLTNKVKRKPYSVVLFDEVEKAHTDIFNILLQVLDDGRLTDSQGTTVNFANTVVILTSNLGAAAIGNVMDPEQMRDTVMQAVKGHFRPEFINRLDEVCIFRRLDAESMRPIVGIQLGRLQKLLAERQIVLNLDDSVLQMLAEQGYQPEFGARPLKRLIQRLIQDPLSEAILEGKITDKQLVNITLDAEGKVAIAPAAPAAESKGVQHV